MRIIPDHCPLPLSRPLRWLATATVAVGLLASTSCADTTRLLPPVSPELAAQLHRLDQERQRVEALQGTIQREMERVEREMRQPTDRPTPTRQTPPFTPGGRRDGR